MERVAIVTGAAFGIGKATALAFSKAGMKVALADWSEEGALVAQQIEAATGNSTLFVKCDISKTEQVKNLITQTVNKFGRLDYAFNNAGIEGEQNSTIECSEENWQRVIDINLKGIWLCMKYEIPEMLKVGGGAIVNCSSIAGVIGFQGIPAYTASKHGVVGLTKTAALEFAKQNIRVNAVNPGVIATPMIDRFTKNSREAQENLVAGAPMARMGKPEEIAETVLWLCSEKSSYITGHALVADGGWVAQ
jgi:NAD(P)-dependent dehydrogenase (short-subunit alcohol dehydrogenase family)